MAGRSPAPGEGNVSAKRKLYLETSPAWQVRAVDAHTRPGRALRTASHTYPLTRETE